MENMGKKKRKDKKEKGLRGLNKTIISTYPSENTVHPTWNEASCIFYTVIGNMVAHRKLQFYLVTLIRSYFFLFCNSKLKNFIPAMSDFLSSVNYSLNSMEGYVYIKGPIMCHNKVSISRKCLMIGRKCLIIMA